MDSVGCSGKREAEMVRHVPKTPQLSKAEKLNLLANITILVNVARTTKSI